MKIEIKEPTRQIKIIYPDGKIEKYDIFTHAGCIVEIDGNHEVLYNSTEGNEK